MLRVGLSSCGFELDEENFQQLLDAGIKDIEISLPLSQCQQLDYAKVGQLADTYGINLWSYHLPFGGVDVLDIASQDEALRVQTLKCWCDLIAKASAIGIKIFVVHPSSEPKAETPEERAGELAQAKKSLRTLADVAEACGGVIAVENLPRSCLGSRGDEMQQLLSADERLRMCFDTNHSLYDDLYDFAERLADKMITLHVSDYDFINERHWLPGEGKIDWPRLYDVLVRGGYSGVWLYEVGLKCPETIIRDRDLTAKDFARNASEIFGGRPLTVIGRQKENLGYWG